MIKNKLQKLIKKLEADASYAKGAAADYKKLKKKHTEYYYMGAEMAYEVAAQLVTNILNEETVAASSKVNYECACCGRTHCVCGG